MTIVLNMGRLVMVAWIVYAVILIFAPGIIHRQPDQTSGVIQFIVAFALGHLLDRALSAVRRRRSAQVVSDQATNDAGTI